MKTMTPSELRGRIESAAIMKMVHYIVQYPEAKWQGNSRLFRVNGLLMTVGVNVAGTHFPDSVELQGKYYFPILRIASSTDYNVVTFPRDFTEFLALVVEHS